MRSAKRSSPLGRHNTSGFRVGFQNTNKSPFDLNSTALLTIAENQPVGTVVGEFNATDPDAGATLTYHLVSGAGSDDNHLFTMDVDGTLRLAQVLDYESDITVAFRTLPGIALNVNPGFEDGLTGWSIYGDGNASEVTVPSLVQQGQKAINFYRYGPSYARLIGTSSVQLYAGRTYSFSIDLLNYGSSHYPGDTLEVPFKSNQLISDIGNSWKRLSSTVTLTTDLQLNDIQNGNLFGPNVHFAKFKPGAQYLDNAVVLDITDDDGDGVPHYLEDISVAGYGDDPFFLSVYGRPMSTTQAQNKVLSLPLPMCSSRVKPAYRGSQFLCRFGNDLGATWHFLDGQSNYGSRSPGRRDRAQCNFD